MASVNHVSKMCGGRQTSKNTQKHVVGEGFPPKTRGRIISTPMPITYSSSLIFYPNLHTKFEALAPREPRDRVFCSLAGLSQKGGVEVRSTLAGGRANTNYFHQPAGRKRGRGSNSVQKKKHTRPTRTKKFTLTRVYITIIRYIYLVGYKTTQHAVLPGALPLDPTGGNSPRPPYSRATRSFV